MVELLARRAALIGDLQSRQQAIAAESDRQRSEIERLTKGYLAAADLQDRMSAELERWRERVAAMEATRAWRLRAWLLRWRRATPLPNAFGRELSGPEIASGAHRELVGGLWDELGALQLEFLVRQGLRPEMTLLDLGCGCLRGGVHLIPYLDPGNYFGIDANASLVRSAWEIELPRAGLAGRLSRQNLLVNRDFEAWRFGVSFDMVLAQSVFTHLPREWLARCLAELARCVRPGGSFFATYFHCPPEWPPGEPRHDAAHGGTTFWDRDPFHYRESDLEELADTRTWEVEHLRAWGHPRGQWMVRFRRWQD
jgi:SAM-dependent methyltransferase